MLYLFAIIVLATLAYVSWRLIQVNSTRPKTRVIGPDDDPEFLRRLGREDNPRP